MSSNHFEYLHLYLQIWKVFVLDSSTSKSTWPQRWCNRCIFSCFRSQYLSLPSRVRAPEHWYSTLCAWRFQQQHMDYSIWTTAYRTSLCDEWACRIITPKCIHDRLGSYNYIGVCGVCVRRLHQITTWILVSVFTTKRNTIIAKCAPFTFSVVLLRENVRTSWQRYGRWTVPMCSVW